MLKPSDEPESFPVRSCGSPFILTWWYTVAKFGGEGGGVPIIRMAVFGVYVWVHLHLFVEATTFPVYLGDQLQATSWENKGLSLTHSPFWPVNVRV